MVCLLIAATAIILDLHSASWQPTLVVDGRKNAQLFLFALNMADEKQATSKAAQDGLSRKIVFFHPDLGIGGAERLIVDAAVGLQELGNNVVIYTSHCDPRHCFEEARDGKSISVLAHTMSTTYHRFSLFAGLRH